MDAAVKSLENGKTKKKTFREWKRWNAFILERSEQLNVCGNALTGSGSKEGRDTVKAQSVYGFGFELWDVARP